ncbi:MAG: cytochrome P450 [Hyphomicrobiaceae bacterium]
MFQPSTAATAPDARIRRFPIGASLTHAELEADPYPLYRRLRETEPVSWVPAHGMVFVTRYDLCRDVLLDDTTFVVGFERSTVHDILGLHMMSTEGAEARRYKNAHRRPFLPAAIRAHLEPIIRSEAERLIGGFADDREVELRHAFASRLPILVMLALFGLPAEDETRFRHWYDAFEAALANTAWIEDVRQSGKRAVSAFHAHMQSAIDAVRTRPRPGTLLSELVHASADDRLSDAEIRHNASIIFFGGISTVEALVLNTLYALSRHPSELASVREDRQRLAAAIEETIRWLGPVQTAHRCVTRATELARVPLAEGDVVAAVLGAANHDPAVFPEPERFDPARTGGRHLGFAIGPHLCLGQHLARAEARIAIDALMTRWPAWRTDPVRPAQPSGAEFRQPKSLWLLRA